MPVAAHSANVHGVTHDLKKHVTRVANLAEGFAGRASWRQEARLAGLLHDLGKYGAAFQARLRGEMRGVDHWSAGAWQALKDHRAIAASLAIQGHHLGLQTLVLEWMKAAKEVYHRTLVKKHPQGLTLADPDPAALMGQAKADGLVVPAIDRPLFPPDGGGTPALVGAMLDQRLLFSTLVDADYLNTEEHFQGKDHRPAAPPFDPERALAALERYRGAIRKKSRAATGLDGLREALFRACRDDAAGVPGLRTLTAPTGTGKTLAMLGFALEHARCYEQRRVVFVVPYLTIIEQTVAILRDVFPEEIFGPDFVLEHHSLAGLDRSRAREAIDDAEDAASADKREAERRRQLLTENWDAPIVVTTSVQILESLFANRPGPCRKLHRLMDSVILFDEVQTLPLPLAVPTLAALSHLSATYRTTVVFATATQPAFSHFDPPVRCWADGGWQPREMVPADLDLFGKTRRTRVVWLDPDAPPPADFSGLAKALAGETQALCVVNLKRHAAALIQALKQVAPERAADIRHLSTSLCPRHRQAVLAEVNARLKEGRPCLLVATQCIEAGVDVSFPKVWRALAPLDAIAQAAGRCNRNGEFDGLGTVTVFPPPKEKSSYPSCDYRQAADNTLRLLKAKGADGMDIHDPALFHEYYQSLYSLKDENPTTAELARAIEGLNFPEVARNYHLIDTDAVNLLVPYGEARAEFEALCDRLLNGPVDGALLRKCRPLAINIFRSNLDRLPKGAMIPVNTLADRDGRTDWYLCDRPDHYDSTLGYQPPDTMDVLIG